MSWLRDLPIRRKLTLVILTTCAVSLLLACLSLAVFEAVAFRRALVRDTAVLADVIGSNTRAALAFDDPQAATSTLASLELERQVVAARLYTRDGAPFAEYLQEGLSHALPKRAVADGHRFEPGRLVVVAPVMLEGTRMGTIHLEASLAGMAARLRLLLGVAVLALVGSLVIAALVSARLQRAVSRPIIDLAETAQSITDEQNFSLRATEYGRDEVGNLTRVFNQMLAGIEEHERALSATNAALLAENVERRLAEARAQAQLTSLELLNRITRATGERQDLPSIYQVVVSSLVEDLPSACCCIGLFDPTSGSFTIVAHRADDDVAATCLSAGAALGVDSSGLRGCLRGQLVYEPDTSVAPTDFARTLAGGGLRSLVAAPLVLESTVFGALLVTRREPDAFTSNECQFLRQLSEHVTLAANQAQLYGALQQAYEELRQTQQAIMQQERLRALGEMASGIAHDLNNALSPVALYTELIREEEQDLSQNTRDYLDITQCAVHDIAETVARLREFYRHREPQLVLEPIPVHPLLRQVVELTRGRWKAMPLQHGVVIHVETDLSAEPISVMGVESELREALTNLIFNAADAMPEGGTITLTTRIENHETRLGGMGLSGRVLIEVRDTGVGMDEVTRNRCLEPFYTTKGERGTGLGLAMVYGTVQRHNGDIEIESSPGSGTTVRLVFPEPVETGSATPRAEVVGRSPRRLRILAVDDDPLVLRAVCHALETDGHVVQPAHGGQAGIDAFRAARDDARPFALVITDLGMPHVDGRRVAAAVRAMSAETPVILLTGWGERLLAEGTTPPNIDCVVSKPPKLAELRAAILECSRDSRHDL
jgi:signal transduction histidine kinase/ActR/RegA family two-component response regulator/HAMP domain-containing protein